MPRLGPVAVDKIKNELNFIFGTEDGKSELVLQGIVSRSEAYAFSGPRPPVSERDVWLITYGDSLGRAGQKGLETLLEFQRGFLAGLIETIHILPCFPWSSDDGFAVKDYYRIDPALGGWNDIAALCAGTGLMLDAVLNHASTGSEWFQAFREERPGWERRFIEAAPFEEERLVFRPRTLPLFTEFPGPRGAKRVWTTFGPDQADLNAADPATFVDLVDILLFYASKGARALRLDAIGYLWKEPGTSCIHHPKTHAIIRLWRTLLDELAPGTLLVSETNVPQAENLSYFGDGGNEVHMVYQFPLPPLTLHSFQTGDALALRAWLATIGPVSSSATYFNFLSSHDGIGVVPASGWLETAELEAMQRRVLERGGQISDRIEADGRHSPYEMNISWFAALSVPGDSEERNIARLLASHGLLLSLPGVAAIYIHSLVGSLNDEKGWVESGIKRRINRERLDYDLLRGELGSKGHRRERVFAGLSGLVKARRACAAFHPMGSMALVDADPRLVAFERRSPDGTSRVLVVVNCSQDRVPLSGLEGARKGRDLLGGSSRSGTEAIDGYGVLWLSLPEPTKAASER